jgi:uncharacterized protein VirK/YbjX
MDFLYALYQFLFKKKRDWSVKYWWKRIKHLLDMLLHVNMMRTTYMELKALDVVTDEKLSQITQRMISGDYCGKNFTLTEKLNTVLYHYRIINQLFLDTFLPTSNDQIVLWQNKSTLHRYEIRLAGSDHPTEGEISLLFFMNDLAIYTISFTFVQGKLLRKMTASGSDGILVARVQGLKDSKSLVHTSSKEHFQSYPTFLLYAALQGIAKAMRRQFIIGICADASLNFNKDQQSYYGAYNAFWEKLGGHRLSENYFELPATLCAKSLKDVSAHHRKRALNRHQLKQNIADEAAATMALYLVNQGD